MNLYIYIKTKIIKPIKVFFLLLLVVGCDSDDDSITQPVDTISGFWSIPEKGWIFEFKKGEDIFYNVNTAGCSIQNDDFILQDFFGFDFDFIDENELVASSELSDSEIKFIRLPNQNPSCLPDQISATTDPKVNFDHFWNILNDYYAFFETRNVDWAQYESLRDQVTEENLYDIIEDLAYLFEDSHLSIVDEKNNIDINSGDLKLLEQLNANLSGDFFIENQDDYDALFNQKAIDIVTTYLDGDFEIDERENIIWGLIGDDIGYVLIATMEGYGTGFGNELSSLNTLLDEILNGLLTSGVSKLIIDMRFNNGGYDTVALDLVSRFIEQERVGYFKKARLGNSFTENKPFSIVPKGEFQFTEDIAILTSPFTVSAAELFTLCLKDLPYVTIVGENTNGSFSTILEHTLPNGAVVGLSNEVYSDVQGVVYEAIGIGPENLENRIPFLSSEDFLEEKDSGIERALKIINN